MTLNHQKLRLMILEDLQALAYETGKEFHSIKEIKQNISTRTLDYYRDNYETRPDQVSSTYESHLGLRYELTDFNRLKRRLDTYGRQGLLLVRELNNRYYYALNCIIG